MKSNARPLLVLAVGLSLAALPALGEEAKDAKSSGSVTFGAQGGSGIEDSSKLQQYEIVHKGVFVPDAGFTWQNDSNFFLNFKSSNLGLDDQSAVVTAGKKKGLQLNLSWDMNPNWMSNTARTPYTETSPGVFHVPDGMRLALQNIYAPWSTPTAGNPAGTPPSPCVPSATVACPPANAAANNFFAVEKWVSQSQPIDLRYVRKTGRAGLTLPLGEKLNFSLTYSREQRDGNKNTTFYGGPSYEVATPIAFRTHNVRAAAEFSDGRWFGNASVNFSKFENEVPYAEIDNPERLEMQNPAAGSRAVYNDAATFRLWLPPDNKAYSIDLSGGVKLPKRHKVTAVLSTGNMSMDTPLLPISTNPNLAAGTVASPFTVSFPNNDSPYSSVSAKYDTLMGSLKVTGDPVKRFGYSLSFRRYELKDKTQAYTFKSSARGDVGGSYSTTGFTREHEGYSTQSLKGEVHVLPMTGLRLGLSYGTDERKYDIREYADVEDKVISVTADYTYRWASLHGVFTNLKREPGEGNEEAIQPTWQGATQTDITQRDRKSFSGLLTLTPTASFGVTLSAMSQTNSFPESVTGLLDQSFSQFGVDLTYAPNARFNAYGGYSYEQYKFDMAAAYIPRGTTVAPNFDPTKDPNYWANATDDKIDTFRAGFQWTIRPERFDLNVDVDYTKPRNASDYTFVPGGAGEANGVWPATAVTGFTSSTFNGFPLVSKNFLIAKVRLSYKLDKNLTASLMWWKQKFDNVDWQNDASLQPYMGRTDPGSNRWFFLGAQVPSYDADIFRVSVTYKF